MKLLPARLGLLCVSEVRVTYSLDLRQRVVAAVDADGSTHAQVASRFAVSLGWVRKLLSQRRRTGEIKPVGHRGEAPPAA